LCFGFFLPFSVPFVRLTALVTVLLFTTNTLLWGQVPLAGAPQTPNVLSSRINSSHTSFAIPQELGTVIERVPSVLSPSPEKPFLIHIQDAHANPQAQENTAKILEHLNKEQGIDLVFVEAAQGNLDAQQLIFTEDPALNQKIVKRLAKLGELTSADIYLSRDGSDPRSVLESQNRPYSMEFIGIENPDHYKENFEQLKEVLRREEETRQWLSEAEKKMDGEMTRLVTAGVQRTEYRERKKKSKTQNSIPDLRTPNNFPLLFCFLSINLPLFFF